MKKDVKQNNMKKDGRAKYSTVFVLFPYALLLSLVIHKIYNEREANVRSTEGEVDISPKRLVDIFNQYEGPMGFDRWMPYAIHYDTHLQQILKKIPNSKTFRMLEIGVQSGGSIDVWKSYFSSHPFYYVGMDIQPRCKRNENTNQNIFIEIGSQLSSEDLINICKKHGPFDFILDDGGHTFDQMKTAIDTLFPMDICMTRNSLYAIEDMHTMAMDGYSKLTTDIPSIPSEIFRKMHYYWYTRKHFKTKENARKEDASNKVWADSVDSISLYDSLMFVHRGYGTRNVERIRKGTDWIPY